MSRWVVIAYHPTGRDVGKCVELEDEQAKEKVREGRARYATDEEVADAEAKKATKAEKASADTDSTDDAAPAKAAARGTRTK